jgi:hypothetical protein
MAELKSIAETLRRQRESLDADMESTSTRQGENTKLLENIEKLRKRVAATRANFGGPVGDDETR